MLKVIKRYIKRIIKITPWVVMVSIIFEIVRHLLHLPFTIRSIITSISIILILGFFIKGEE